MQTNIPDLRISLHQAKLILSEFPQIRAAYSRNVPCHHTELEFWQEFLMKNNKYQTEVFGGNNPIFVPFETDEIEYDDIYVNDNLKQLELKRKPILQEKLSNLSQDLNFKENATTRLNAFYGTYPKKYEAD